MRTQKQIIAAADDKLASFRIDELARQNILPPSGEFLPVVRYPEITLYPFADAATLFAGETERPRLPVAGYVHVPFCANDCHYCHWVKMIDPPDEIVDDYIDTVTAEMKLALARLGRENLPLSTVLFGGGTPTYLTPAQLERLLRQFTELFDLSRCRQFSFEAEPNTLLGAKGRERMRVLRDFGVDRISLGVQSFDDNVLEMMGRPHTGAAAIKAIEAIREAGFDTVMIDLIYGYPAQTIGQWIEALQTAARLPVDGWQLYRLRILQHGLVQGNILAQLQNRPELFPGVETIFRMKMLGIMLSEESGFGQHFTRMFTKEARHSSQFMWDYCCYLTDVIGLGPSAWSNYHRTFAINGGEDYMHYRAMVNAGRLPVIYGMVRDVETDARRSLITPLKCDRVYKRKFKHRLGFGFDEHFGPELARLQNMGLLTDEGDTVRLTERGRFFADETVTQLFQKQYLPFPDVAHDLMPE